MARRPTTTQLPGAVAVGSMGGLVKLDQGVTAVSGQIIQNATPRNSGVMTKLQASQLAALVAGGGGGAGATNFNVVLTAGPTYDANYNDLVEADTTANAIVVNLPAASTVSPSHGNVLVVKNVGTNQSNLVRVNPSLGDSVDGRAAISTVLADGETMYVVSDGVSNFITIVLPGTSGIYNIRQLGAIGDGLTHPLSSFFASLAAAQTVYPFATSLTEEIDWAATQLAINLAADGVNTLTQNANGGTVLVPKGVFRMGVQTIAKPASQSVLILGVGHGSVGTGNQNDGPSVLVFDGDASVTRMIDARSTQGFVLQQLSIVYTNNTFVGDVVDYSHFNGSDSGGGKVIDCCISGGLAVNIAFDQGARSLVFLGNAIDCEITSNTFGVSKQGVRFRNGDGSYSNSHQVTNCRFVYENYALVNADEAIQVSGCTFEGSAGVMKAAYFDDYTNVQAAAPRTFVLDPIAGTITADSGDFTTDGWVVGQQVTCFELIAGVNTTTFNAPVSNVAALVLTLAGVSNMVAETRTHDCMIYSNSTTPSVASPTSEATLGIQLTFAADGSITRDNGSWLDDNTYVGQSLTVLRSALNNGSFSPVTSVSAKVLSFGAVQLTFAGGGNTITRDNGDFTQQGWQIGQIVHVDGTASNNGIYGAVSNVTAKVLTVTGAVFVAEASTTGDIYSLFETQFTSRTQASAGIAFVPEVSTTADVFQLAGTGPFQFNGNWLGDQFLPSTWLQFSNLSAANIVGNQFVGNLRALSASQGMNGVSLAGNHIVTTQEPIYLGGQSSGISVRGNAMASGAADIVTGPGLGSTGNIDVSANTEPGPAVAADFINLGLKSWVMSSTTPMQLLVPIAAGLGLEISQGGAHPLFLGGDASMSHVQGSGILALNWLGTSTWINAFGFGFCMVGFPYQEVAGNATSLLHCMGAFSTVYTVIDTDTDLSGLLAADAYKYSNIGIDSSINSPTLTLPDATACRGREYMVKSVVVGAGTAHIGTFAGQTVDGVAGPISLPAQWNWYHVVSDGTNWLVKSKG